MSPPRSQSPPRKRMKPGITRVRTGCYTCRRRKVKCDEEKPACRACNHLGLRCEGYALRYKFCDPQTLNAAALVPERSSAPQQSAALKRSDQFAYSTTLRSGSRLDDNGFGEFPSIAIDTLLSSKSSFGDASETGTQIQSNNASINRQYSPFNNAFLSTVGNWASTDYCDPNLPVRRLTLSAPQIGFSSPEDTTSSSDSGDTSYASTTPESILPAFKNTIHLASPLTRIRNSASLTEFYFTQWHNGVAPLLPPVFRDITTEIPDFPPLRNAILAISAAYVAHLESLIVRTAHRRNRKSYYIPQKDHQYQSLQYYNKVITGIGQCVEMPPQMKSLDVLATLLLSYYFELDSGSFTGGIGHMTVIDKFLASHDEEIRSYRAGQKLLSTWMNLRSQFVNRYLGSHISSMPSHSIDTFPLNRTIDKGESHNDSITIMMCDCKLLSRRIILDLCVARGETRSGSDSSALDKILTQISIPKPRRESVSQLAAIDDGYWKSLAEQRERLDEWHSTLDLSELPIESYVSQRQGVTGQSSTEMDKIDILPLKFHTFEAAMNYTYYAHAQLMCSQDVIPRLKGTKFVVPALTRKDSPWAELILRITAGIQISDCIYKNIFTAGILSTLAACIVLCPRADVATWIQDWIRRVEDFGIPLESGLPFGIIKRIISFILDERKSGRDVLFILPLDTEDADKSDLYQSDFKMQVAVCGKDMHTGKMYNETVEMPEV
ncbi:hypothetical protein UA08_03137 [Talaromyces atroroseus]|uniref:Zn(2)-C6 fungal-type domain-containing protein n=1 Tax=Talaromyces atroroseus TaxID=1441469 RepID=A0A225B1E5_TALAT|nr:hypothetical protein UA08_03137 [Talaromyces atroroseus]OKL61056.1 hypothetical protein UA08_03137 [Talaromyces atroroseus]